MAPAGTVVATLRLVVGDLWTGGALFFAFAVLPIACTGNTRAAAFESVVSRLTVWSHGASLMMFAIGGHLAGARCTVDSLFGSGRDYLILGMLALWFVLTGLVEVGHIRVKNGPAEKKVRTPAEKIAPFYLGAVLVVAPFLVDAGLLLNWRRPRLPETP